MAYVEKAKHSADAFMKSGTLFDREGTMHQLLRIMGDNAGQFVLFVGDKNLGKSYMLRALTRLLNDGGKHRVLYINARGTGDDLMAGIAESINAFDSSFISSLRTRLGQLSSTAVAIFDTLVGAGGFVSTIDSAAMATPPTRALLSAFIDTNAADGKYSVIIVEGESSPTE